MKYAINIPNFGYFGTPENIAYVAEETEKAGWDGLFIWDHLQAFPEWHRGLPFIDPWIAMTIIAMKTSKIHFGPFITPLPRRRPWQVYRQAVSLDHLSKGRIILGFGIGTPEFDFTSFNDDFDLKIRAKMLDEGLEIIIKLFENQPINYEGEYYQLKDVQLTPGPYNQKIPIFIGGGWPNKNPMKRAAKYDGVVPISNNWPEVLTPEEIMSMKNYIAEYREKPEQIEIMVGGMTPSDVKEARKIIGPYREVGVTWWTEDINFLRENELDRLLDRIKAGPPK